MARCEHREVRVSGEDVTGYRGLYLDDNDDVGEYYKEVIQPVIVCASCGTDLH